MKIIVILLLLAGILAGFALGFWMSLGVPDQIWRTSWNAAWIASIVWTFVLAFLFRRMGRSGAWAAVALGCLWAAEILGDFAPNLLNIGDHSLTAYRFTEGHETVWWLRLTELMVGWGLYWFVAGLACVALLTIPGWLKRTLFSQQVRSA